MAEVEESIEVNAPLQTVYNQWTQFEEFPRFMEGVESVRQLDDTRLHWVAEIGGRRREWDAEITFQEPDRRVAWRAVDGKYNSGEVTFEPLAPDRTRIFVSMVYDAEGIIEKVGSAVGADDRRVKGDLERFKRLVEERGIETGSWRGKVHEGDVQSERGRGQEDAFDADDRAMPDTGGRSEAVDSAGTGAEDEQAPLLAPRDAEDLRNA